MRRVSIAAALLSAISSLASGQAPDDKAGRAGKAERQVLALNRQWADAITRGERSTLDSLFADDMIVTSGNGSIRDKEDEIKDAVGDGGAHDPDFILTHPFTTEDMRVRVYKGTAVVTGLAKWGFKYKGRQANHEKRYTHTYVRQRGRWRIVAQQMSSNLYRKPQTSQ